MEKWERGKMEKWERGKMEKMGHVPNVGRMSYLNPQKFATELTENTEFFSESSVFSVAKWTRLGMSSKFFNCL